jgi:hypothetical protein
MKRPLKGPGLSCLVHISAICSAVGQCSKKSLPSLNVISRQSHCKVNMLCMRRVRHGHGRHTINKHGRRRSVIRKKMKITK